jgi:hypothetical protein
VPTLQSAKALTQTNGLVGVLAYALGFQSVGDLLHRI